MKRKLSRTNIALLLVTLLLLDQIVRIYVKTHFLLDETVPIVGNWFFIRFMETPASAFGEQIIGHHGKLVLSLFRIAVVALLFWYINRLINKKSPRGVIVGLTLIVAGTLCNVLDNAFYGLIFSESTHTAIATMFPEIGGYAGFLQGKGIDLLYFPLFKGTYPSWFPWVGGNSFTFFNTVFNIADVYIFSGLFYLIFFQRKFFRKIK